jgi:hypothetical protein
LQSSLLQSQSVQVANTHRQGYPKGSPSTSPYFSTPQHPYDRYSISFSFTPKDDISGDDLVFGNDFDHPIRDRLPPLFDKAFGIVKWWIDPGLDGDVYGDEPYLYGPLLSSINVLRICGKEGEDSEEPKPDVRAEDSADEVAMAESQEKETSVDVYEEGAEGSGSSVREKQSIPGHPPARQKFFLTEANRKSFTFEGGREYRCDFFNPYLDFNEFALKIGYGLPTISIIRHWDGQPLRYVCLFPIRSYVPQDSPQLTCNYFHFILVNLADLDLLLIRTHSLRYVLKNRKTKQELFVVMIQLLPIEQTKQDEADEDEEQQDSANNDLD